MQTTKLTPTQVANEVGKAAFQRNDFPTAIENFTKAIAEDEKNVLAYSNRAAAYTALAKTDASKAANLLSLAIKDADATLQLDPKFLKGFSRKGTALFALKKFSEARKAFSDGLQIDPTDKVLLDGISAVNDAVEKAAESARQKGKKGKGSASSSAAAGVSASVEEDDVVVGIDLGTTYSCVGYWKDNAVEILPNDRGDKTTPSYVSFSKTGKRTVGQAAKVDAARNPKNTIFDVKRFIGQTLKDSGVAQDVRRYPYRVVEREEKTGRPGIEVDLGSQGNKIFAPEEISAMVLSYLKKCAEKHLGKRVTRAVITVPAYFNDSQRAATKAAGAIAGLDVLRIINEPTAAALAYGLDRKSLNLESNVATTILVFDLGGGTFDVSVMNISEGVCEVKATGGDTRLGGEDIDHAICEFLFKEMSSMKFPDVSNDARARKRLMSAIEKAKRELSQTESVDITVEALVPRESDQPARDFNYTLTRTELERLCKSLFTRCMDTVKHVLKDAGVAASAIDDIVLVGGSTRIPKIQSLLSEFFGGKQLCKSLNPDEAVAYGAAVQAAIISGKRSKETRDLVLMDVTPLSLGIEVVGKVMSIVIPRNTSIPCVRTQIYTTESNYQTEVDVSVYEGERPKTEDNHFLGEFQIKGIERAKKGEPQIDVSFAIDSNGILNVTARDQKTGSKAQIEIARGTRASDDEVQRMTEQAELYREEDEQNAAILDARNKLEEKMFAIQSAAETIPDKQAAKRNELLTLCEGMSKWISDNEDTMAVKDVVLRIAELDLAMKQLRK